MKNQTRSAYEQYLKDIKKYPLLTREETSELIGEMLNGDKAAREKLINHNLRLVLKVINQYTFSASDFMDIVQQGNLGLIHAIDTYDPCRGAGLSTYMVICIRKYIFDFFYDQMRLIRLPKWQQQYAKKIQDTTEILNIKLNRTPTIDEIASYLNMAPLTVERILEDNTTTISMDLPINEDGDTIADCIADDSEPDASEKMKRAVNAALECLDDEDRELMEYLYGLNGKPQKTYEEIGRMRNMTKQAIHLHKQRVLNKLRYPEYLKVIRSKL